MRVFNAWMNGKHGNQAAPLCTRLCTAAHFCGASTHMDCLRSREQAFRGTADERGGCRPGGDAGWQFRLKSIKDARVLRPSAHRARPWRARECLSSHFPSGIFKKKKRSIRLLQQGRWEHCSAVTNEQQKVIGDTCVLWRLIE